MEKKKNIFDLPEHNKNKTEEQKADSRRRFLKKAAYAAPTLVSLGYLMRPSSGMAESLTAISDDEKYGHPDDFW